jgi:8-oxo-dGTP pyrophosphatase MutT (NUDIX family)
MSTFDPNYKPNPVIAKIGQKILVFNKKGEVLLLQRSEKCTRPHGWDFIGGGLDVGDTPESGIQREAWEECQIHIEKIEPVYIHLDQSGEGNKYVLMIGYKGETVLEQPTPVLSWEHEAYKWVTPEEALQIKLPEFHTQTVIKALAK